MSKVPSPRRIAPKLARVALPTGEITMLFADVEGSTALQEISSRDYALAIGDVRRLVREHVLTWSGVQVDAIGDQIFAVFSDPTAGVRAAVDAQRALGTHEWPFERGVRVRIGLHTGTPELSDEGYTGIDVVRAARISDAGHGGQIIVSAATRAVLDGVETYQLGTYRLTGLSEQEELHQVRADGLARDFPALRNTISTLGNAMRVVIADDSVLLREGVVRLLEEAGFEVAGQSGNAEDLLRHVAMHRPDVAIVDIRMPPTHTDEGLRAAQDIRVRFPGTGVLVLSQYVEAEYALELLTDSSEGVGYLLKDRVSDLEEFAASVRRVAEGGSALDPAVVNQLVGRRRREDPLEALTPREREVLDLMAEGRSNQAIADRLFVTLRAVEKHVTSIFGKLGLAATTDDHRRVLAVLAYLKT
jgi:DNA-binding NarL/FixJ family response regulator/class 3 adenylate cyclase